MLVVLVALATAQVTPFDSLTTGVQWSASEWFMDYPLSSLEEACTTADTAGGNPVWAAVRTVLTNTTYTQCALPGRDDYAGAASSVDCFAAYSTASYAGSYCTGSYCALAASGNFAGMGCTGYMCAAYSGSGCPGQGTTSDMTDPEYFDESVDEEERVELGEVNYAACCSSGQGSGCLGTQCAYMCTAALCGQISIGEQSAWSCVGQNCGRGCQGTECAENCIGYQCGQQCWGTSCAQNSTGESAGVQCMGTQCAYNCTGASCGQYCNGASCAETCQGVGCGQGCTGASCAASCVSTSDPAACGQFSMGAGSAANCQGHGCGKGCTGEGCAYNATSVYTTTTVVAHDSTQTAMNCFNKWIYNGMGIDWVHTAVASTTAPTAAPTAVGVWPDPTTTADPDPTTTTDPDPKRRDRRVPVNTDPALGSLCPLTNGPGGSTDVTNQGPGSFCVGTSCAQNATGAFAASFCSGYECATDVTGLYAGVACVGDYCATGASGIYGAGSFCYGYGCAANAEGAWSGAYCIGNACAQGCTGNRCGTCCVGLNCSSNATSACPYATDAGAPYGMGNYNNLFSDNCRNAIDTTSSTWTSFFNQCASGYNATELLQNFAHSCTISCTDQLSVYLSYYNAQLVRYTYSQSYAAQTLRGSNLLSTSSDDEDESYEIATWVLVAFFGAAIVIMGVLNAGKIGEFFHRKSSGLAYGYAGFSS